MKKLKSFLKYGLTLAVAFGLLAFVFRDINLKRLIHEIKQADFTYVYISVIMSLVSHFFRGYRWTLLLEPIGYKVNSFRAFLAVMVGYFANLLLPRMGEVTRCAILKKTDSVAVPASLGSVISERILDMILLLILIFTTTIVEFNVLKDFMYELLQNISDSFNLGRLIVYGGGFILLVLIILILFRKNRSALRRFDIYHKIKPFLYDLLNGLTSIKKVRHKGMFAFSTAMIWILYFFMSYIIVFSLPQTSSLGIKAGLSILMAGGLGMAAPVQGGIGTYHAFVSGVLLLYGIEKADGVLFATLLHTSQFISIVVFGGTSFIISLFLQQRGKKSD